MSDSNNKRIAKNSLALYVRMLFALVVGLYTSRVVLQVLGIEDYGVYNVVGGVVGMLGFLNSTMSGATSRFLTYELGRGDEEKMNLTFNSALVVHAGIALIVFIIAQSIGLWFVCNKIVVPDERMTAAIFVYEFSIFSSIISVIQVPYSACVIAHEKIDVFAYVEIFKTLSKLLIIYLLFISIGDKLIVYGFLLLVLYLVVFSFYIFYCARRFNECRIRRQIDKESVRGILSFSGYNLFGNFGGVVNRQTTVILINNFFGLVYNAACGVATTVANMIMSFANNMITVFRPPITKSYAANKMDEVGSLTLLALNISLFVLIFVAVPAMIEMETLYQLWLVEVPDGAVLFTRLIIVGFFFDIIRWVITIDIHATGKVRYVSLANGLLLSLNPILIYIVFTLFNRVYLAFVCEIVVQLILSFIVIFLAKHYIPSLSVRNIFFCIGKILFVAILTSCLLLQSSLFFEEGILHIVIITIESCLLLSLMAYFICLNCQQRRHVKAVCLRKLLKK